MTSFQRLFEHMSKYREEEDKLGSSQAMEAIRTGLNIRPDFWDDFLLVVNNSDGLAALLDIPRTSIVGWHSKVRAMVEKVKQHDAVPDPKKKGKLLHTGNDDPFGGGGEPEPPKESDSI